MRQAGGQIKREALGDGQKTRVVGRGGQKAWVPVAERSESPKLDE